MKIVGPLVEVTRTVEFRDIDHNAYWHLDWEGNEDNDGAFLYARVAFPRLADAQHQHQLEASQGQTAKKKGK